MSKTISNEVTKMVACEISEQELDKVIGGLSVLLGDIRESVSQAINEFFTKELPVVPPAPPIFNEVNTAEPVIEF